MKIIHDAVTIMTPLLLAAVGGLFTELAGTLNIALEGFMMAGAFSTIVFAHIFGNVFSGIMAGMGVTLVFAFAFGFGSIYFKTNIFVSGLAVNLLASGLTAMLSGSIFGTKGNIVFSEILPPSDIHIPVLDGIPVIGELFSGYNIFVYLGALALFISHIVIYHTSFGLRLRGSGIDPHTMESLGLKIDFYKLAAILVSGALCSLAGGMLALSVSAFVPGITAGRGWIALVVIYLGNKSTAGILGASFLFGLAISFSNYAQGAFDISSDLILAFPYLITLVLMSIYGAYKTKRRREGVEV